MVNVDLFFPANSPTGTQRCFNFPLIDDAIKELTEFCTLSGTVSDPRCIFQGAATLNIEDNESMFRSITLVHSLARSITYCIKF